MPWNCHALALRHGLVAGSRWFADVVGDRVAALAAGLPAERVALAKERGQARDLRKTTGELFRELRP